MTQTMSKRDEKLAALQAEIAAGVKALQSSEEWRAMLETAARFHKYSFRNVLLIAVQCPQASRVAGYNKWIELGRQVRKGEKAISILAPCTYRRELQPGEEGYRPGRKTTVTRLRGFRPASVFDISQTDGEPLPDVAPTLAEQDEPAGLWGKLEEYITGKGWTVERGDCGLAYGWADPATKVIRVRDGVHAGQAAKTLIHECAHALLHFGDRKVSRDRAEVEAESTAYVVAGALGMPTGSYSFPYVASWAGDAVEEAVANTADAVLGAAKELLEVMGE